MSKMIQLRNVPDELHGKLKAKAATAGMSLSEFLIREARKVAEIPTREEMRQRLASREPVDDLGNFVAETIREMRDGR